LYALNVDAIRFESTKSNALLPPTNCHPKLLLEGRPALGPGSRPGSIQEPVIECDCLSGLAELRGEFLKLLSPSHQADYLWPGLLSTSKHRYHGAVDQYSKAVPYRERMVRIVCDEDYANSAIARLRNESQNQRCLLNAQRRRGLVKNQNTSAEIKRPRDRQALTLSA
jgi:hypothetical protein